MCHNNKAGSMRDGGPPSGSADRTERSRSQWSVATRTAMAVSALADGAAVASSPFCDGCYRMLICMVEDRLIRRVTEESAQPSPPLPLVAVFHCTALHCAERTRSYSFKPLDSTLHMAAPAAAADGSAVSLSAAAAAAQPAAAPTGASSSAAAPSLLERALADEATEWSAIHPNTQRLAARGLTRSVLLPDVSVAVAGRDLLSLTTLRFMDGHKYGLVGQNGCGKSTLLRRIASGQIGGWPKHLRCHLVQVSPTEITGGQRTGEAERQIGPDQMLIHSCACI